MSIKAKRKQQQYVPKNPQKYTGRYPVIIRSNWERLFCQWLDANPSVIEWSSESVTVYYYDPVQRKQRRYYPDFYAKIINKSDSPVRFLIELKPEHELHPPKKGKKSKKTLRYQEATYLTNQAKFKAAEKFSKKMGMRWKLLTEKQLFKETT